MTMQIYPHCEALLERLHKLEDVLPKYQGLTGQVSCTWKWIKTKVICSSLATSIDVRRFVHVCSFCPASGTKFRSMFTVYERKCQVALTNACVVLSLPVFDILQVDNQRTVWTVLHAWSTIQELRSVWEGPSLQLFDILRVNTLDEIVPSVRTLASSQGWTGTPYL